MKKQLQKITLIALLLLVFQISTIKVWAQSNPTTTGPIGSQLAFGVNEDIKYWNGTLWVAIPSGLPGQSLTFPNGIPTWVNNPNGIITNAVTNISGTTATCGGHIASSSGSPITARGVCWSTNSNPTIADSHTSDDIGKGDFTSYITGVSTNIGLYIRAYATNNAGTTYGNEVSFLYDPAKVYDIDGKAYDTVHIGDQIWMKQNLNVIHYRNGDAVPNVVDITTGAYTDYNDMVSNSTTYGRLYNWYTVVDTRNLCPTGWHVPSDAEWTILTTYLGGESIAGGKLKEASLTHWNSPNTAATNATGFKAIPSGYRNRYAYFDKGNNGYWWSSTQFGIGYAMSRSMSYNNSNVYRFAGNPHDGYSVRCIKDSVIILLKPVYDIDGNGYDTVHIGSQNWMKENLKTTHYRNGDAIPNVTDNTAWSNLTTGAYCTYNNDTNNANTYGRLYNWYTVVDSRNLCPTGWHIPSDGEWATLTTYLGGETIAGGKLKEVGTIHWQSPNTGATNETGFTTLPAGYRLGYGAFASIGDNSGIWSSTELDNSNAWYKYMLYDYTNVISYFTGKIFGWSVRCLKD